MSDNDFSEIYKKLSYSMKERTDRIINLRNKIIVKDQDGKRFFFSAVLSAVYIGVFFRNYILLPPVSSVLNLFSDAFAFFGVQRITNLPVNIPTAIINYIVLSIFIITAFLAHSAFNAKGKLEAEYEKTRTLIKNSIDIDLCNCSISCDCKDKYLKYMNEKENIDLIF